VGFKKYFAYVCVFFLLQIEWTEYSNTEIFFMVGLVEEGYRVAFLNFSARYSTNPLIAWSHRKEDDEPTWTYKATLVSKLDELLEPVDTVQS
jgi:hypothetical protein